MIIGHEWRLRVKVDWEEKIQRKPPIGSSHLLLPQWRTNFEIINYAIRGGKSVILIWFYISLTIFLPIAGMRIH